MTRRAFLRAVAGGSGAAWLAARGNGLAQMPSSRIIDVESGSLRQDDQIDASVLRRMVDEGVVALTGARSVESAWKRIVAPNDIVGIKVDASVASLSTHSLLVDEVVRAVVAADVPPDNVIVWDRFGQDLERYDYQLKALPDLGFEEPRGRVLASEGGEGTIRRVGYDENAHFDSEDEDLPSRREDGTTLSFYSRIVTELATRIICLPVLKYHPITGVYGTLAGLAFGSLNNTFRFHPRSGDGMPVIAEIWRESILREKHALTIVDGLTGAYNTGPGYDPQWFWNADRLFVSHDPVAADTLILEAVNGQRTSPLKPLNQKSVSYLRRAASYALGANDPDEMERRSVEVS